jgi:hypothetical protein
MTGAKQKTRTTKTSTVLTGSVATNAGGITKLSTPPGNEGESK